MIVLFFIGRSSNPTSEYNFYENIFFIFSFPYQPFQCIGRNYTFTSAVTYREKDSLAVDKTYDKSHRLHAMHYNIDLVVILTTSSVYFYHKEKTTSKPTNKTSNFQTKKSK